VDSLTTGKCRSIEGYISDRDESMASALVVSTVAQCALTELIRVLIETSRSVRKCKSECGKLEKELEEIKPDVERLERRLWDLQRRACNTGQEDIKMVEEWLERLKRAIDLDKIEVHRCNSSRL
jgi:predicted RNase H-like nuclease (RuvC/YqgF family)